MPALTLIPVFCFGAIVGSFLNVCIVRLPKDESIVFPGSHCTHCGGAIAWFDNIPLVSFFTLGRRCRLCRKPISPQYAAVEVSTALLFVLIFAAFGISPKAFVTAAFASALLVVSVIDWRHRIIPDEISLPGAVIGLAVSAVFPSLHGESHWWAGLLQAAAGFLLGGGFLYVVGTLAEKILKKEAMGGGDVKLLAMIGTVVGWRGVLWTIFVSSFLGSVAGIYLRLKKGEEIIPYGPYLAAAGFLYLWIGDASIRWYFDFIAGH